MAKLRQRDDVIARCLAFIVLTAVRMSTATGATWGEFDLPAKLWIIPPERMKSGRELRVPLSEAALAVLGKPGAKNALVFPGHNPGRPLSQAALLALVQGSGWRWRHCARLPLRFRDWTSEETSFPDKIAEAALAHTVGDETARAYQRATC